MLITNGCVVIGVSVLLRYFSNCGIACHAYLSWGGGGLDLAQTLLRVALAWHNAGSSTPKDPGVNDSFRSLFLSVGQLMRQYFCFWCLQ